MPEPLKLVYSQTFINTLAAALKKAYPGFDQQAFCLAVFAEPWEDLELKARMRRITESLATCLPDYEVALPILKQAAPLFSGFEAMFFPEYVELYGRHDVPLSLEALAYFTRFSSSEFAIRPYILEDPPRLLKQLEIWSTDEDLHVRRLASEGSRPRLPWAQALPIFKKDPEPLFPILENLLDDPERYVQRSVANHLNDISKDHPDRMLDFVEKHAGRSERTDWILKHAARGLLKAGHPRALHLFGYDDTQNVQVSTLTLTSRHLAIGERLNFSFDLHQEGAGSLKLRIEYAIDFVKANGKVSTKVFKITENSYKPGRYHFDRSQEFRDLTTRKHYPGTHDLKILINGEVKAKTSFELSASN